MKIIKRVNGSDIKIFAKTIDKKALKQIKELGEFGAYQNSKIRIMPDCHAGAGCTIGTTMVIKDHITPKLVGVDIGCGMLTVKLKETDIDLQQLDIVVNKFVPHGFKVHAKQIADFNFDKLRAKGLNIDRAKLAIGSLGGGNHFIEIGKNSKGELFLIIHSGSRNIGAQVAVFYQRLAVSKSKELRLEIDNLVSRLSKEGDMQGLIPALNNFKSPNLDLACLSGFDYDNYMHDMKLMQSYAMLNRRTMANIILSNAKLTELEAFDTIHNYIDFNRMILRKGAISSEKDELVLIPINMCDGSILAKGKGNEDWNYSAPHGAGRLMSRKEAHKNLNLKDFQEQMKDIYSTSVLAETLDEAPDAYKSMAEIIDAIKDTVDIIDILKPIYNFKSCFEFPF